MTSLLTQFPSAVPVTEEVARSTIEPLTEPDDTAEAPHAPDYNEFINDPTIFPGIAPHAAGSDWTQGEQYANWDAPAVSRLFNAAIDIQVSSAGFAPAQEALSKWGHGTMSFAEGIEPVIRDGAEYGEDYFSAGKPAIQQTGGDYMSQPDSAGVVTDRDWAAVAQADGLYRSREASRATLFSAMFSPDVIL